MIYATKFKELPYETKFEVYIIYLRLKGKEPNKALYKNRDITARMNSKAQDVEKVLLQNKLTLQDIIEGRY